MNYVVNFYAATNLYVMTVNGLERVVPDSVMIGEQAMLRNRNLRGWLRGFDAFANEIVGEHENKKKKAYLGIAS